MTDSVTASVLRCPGCGGPAAADDAHCAWCGSALATVTCPSCFGAMFNGSRFCSRCGAEATRELLPEAGPAPCPRCRQPMQALRLRDTPVLECAECGGLWMDHETLQTLTAVQEERADLVSALDTIAPRRAVVSGRVSYVPCPTCSRVMNRVNFAHSSGVIMDVCNGDGVWFDRGELQQVLAFVASGGLAAQRRREREQLIEEQRRLEMLRNYPVTPNGRST